MAKQMTEREFKEKFYKKAEAVKTMAQFQKLFKEVENYKHDYGTIVIGCMAVMTGAFNLLNRSKQGGITGFQASCIGWECIQKFLSLEGPAKIVDYNNMLFPQYEHAFQKVISQETWKSLVEKAKRNIAEDKGMASQEVTDHWKSIVAGQVPFDYVVSQ